MPKALRLAHSIESNRHYFNSLAPITLVLLEALAWPELCTSRRERFLEFQEDLCLIERRRFYSSC